MDVSHEADDVGQYRRVSDRSRGVRSSLSVHWVGRQAKEDVLRHARVRSRYLNETPPISKLLIASYAFSRDGASVPKLLALGGSIYSANRAAAKTDHEKEERLRNTIGNAQCNNGRRPCEHVKAGS
jgi:hypothetical protein